MLRRKNDLTPRQFPLIQADQWNEPEAVLAELYEDAQGRAIEIHNWYLADRIGKKNASRALRILAILLASAGGLIPLANVTTGQAASGWGYILLAGAGVCFGFDRLLGLSAGWMRDMTTAQRIHRRLQGFQFDWVGLEAARAANGGDIDTVPYLQLLRDFAADLSGIITEETNEWIAEFQSGLLSLEAQTGHR